MKQKNLTAEDAVNEKHGETRMRFSNRCNTGKLLRVYKMNLYRKYVLIKAFTKSLFVLNEFTFNSWQKQKIYSKNNSKYGGHVSYIFCRMFYFISVTLISSATGGLRTTI